MIRAALERGLVLAGATVLLCVPAHARSKFYPVSLIEAVCLEPNMSVPRVKQAAVEHLGIRMDDLSYTAGDNGGIHRASFSVQAYPRQPGSQSQLKGELVIVQLPKKPDQVQSCSLSLEGERDGRSAHVEKFNYVANTFQYNHKLIWLPERRSTISGHHDFYRLVRKGRVLTVKMSIENGEMANERLTTTISLPQAH